MNLLMSAQVEITNWRVISALAAGPRTFLKSGKSAKKHLKRHIYKARGPVTNGKRRNDLLGLDVEHSRTCCQSVRCFQRM